MKRARIEEDEEQVIKFLRAYSTTTSNLLLQYSTEKENLICPVCNADIEDLERDTILVDGAKLCRRCQQYVVDARAVVDTKAEMFPREFGGEDAAHCNRASGWCYNRHDELVSNPLLRDHRDPNHRFPHYQPYQRKYHFNERIKMRNNTEPRIPLEALLLIRLAVLAQLPLVYVPDDINNAVVQRACRAFPGLYAYAERWLQVRYFMLTGLQEYDPAVPYDIPQLSMRQAVAMHDLFVQIGCVFDELLYLSSAKEHRRTKKDNKYGNRKPDYTKRNGKPGFHLRRHNIMQYNYIIHQLTLLLFGERAYHEMRTEFCFPLHRSDGALKRLNRMMGVICEKLGLEPYELPVQARKTNTEITPQHNGQSEQQHVCQHCGDSDARSCLCANELRDWLECGLALSE
jgi:hypothetical protein